MLQCVYLSIQKEPKMKRLTENLGMFFETPPDVVRREMH